MCSRGIFFDLLPEKIVILEFCKARVSLLQNERVLGKLFLRQKHVDQPLIDFILVANGRFPLGFILRQIAEY